MLPTLANGAIGYLVGTSIAVIGLYIAYGIPIFLRWRAGDSFEHGAWSLGNHYKWINPLAFLWVVFIVILFLMPTVPTGDPVALRLQLERRQLRADHGRRRLLLTRRLVAPLGAQVVQGPGQRGHRGGARADRGRVHGARRTGDVACRPAVAVRVRTAGGPRACPPLPSCRCTG